MLEAADGEAALAEVETHGPDLVLLDVRLPGLDGIAVAELLAARQTRSVVVLTSGDDADSLGRRLQRAPVRGFVPKHQLTPKVLAAMLGDRQDDR